MDLQYFRYVFLGLLAWFLAYQITASNLNYTEGTDQFCSTPGIINYGHPVTRHQKDYLSQSLN